VIPRGQSRFRRRRFFFSSSGRFLDLRAQDSSAPSMSLEVTAELVLFFFDPIEIISLLFYTNLTVFLRVRDSTFARLPRSLNFGRGYPRRVLDSPVASLLAVPFRALAIMGHAHRPSFLGCSLALFIPAPGCSFREFGVDAPFYPRRRLSGNSAPRPLRPTPPYESKALAPMFLGCSLPLLRLVCFAASQRQPHAFSTRPRREVRTS